jgi:hypothetical protein
MGLATDESVTLQFQKVFCRSILKIICKEYSMLEIAKSSF